MDFPERPEDVLEQVGSREQAAISQAEVSQLDA